MTVTSMKSPQSDCQSCVLLDGWAVQRTCTDCRARVAAVDEHCLGLDASIAGHKVVDLGENKSVLASE